MTNFFRTGLRFLWRNRTYSILNFLCMTFGLTCTIIAVLYIFTLLGYDKFNKNYNRISMVNAYVTFFNGDRFPKPYLSASLNEVLKQEAPEIEESTRLVSKDYTFINGNKSFRENGVYADPNFLNVFTFPLVQGDAKNALNDINSIAISERMALEFFESTDCLGKTLVLKGDTKQEAFKVTGILQNIPAQSTLQFDYVIPLSKFLADNKWANEAGADATQIWALLKNNVDNKLVENKIKNIIKNREATLNQELFLFPLKEKALYSYAAGKRVWTGMNNVLIVGSIGLVILLIACFNFINLTMAIYMRRYREAGIKKVAGSRKRTLVFQFLSETFILILFSLLIAMLLVPALLPGLNTLVGGTIQLHFLDVKVVLFFIGITLFTGLVSGLFPALYLASSSPVSVLKGEIITSHSYSRFRQGLIVFQFVIPVILIICMMIIKVQDSYLHSFKPGVDKEKVIILDNTSNVLKHSESVKAELLSIPGIDAVTFTSCIPTNGTKVSNEVSWEGKDVAEKLLFWCVSTDFDYNKAIEIKMKAGRFFNPAFSSDSTNYVINDVAAEVMKNKQPLGSSITLDGKKGTIVGVITDFHAIDLAGPLVPTIIRINPREAQNLLIKFSSGTFSSLTDKIHKVINKYDPESPFNPVLFSDLRIFSNLPGFSDLSTPSNLVGLAFIIALTLACLGLFGLASFSAESRTKEIGIRKTNGATLTSIMSLLLTSYVKWLAIAFVFALPVAFCLGLIFLNRFYFHATMPLWTFLAGPLVATVISLMTVSSITWRVASRNPVESLRHE